MNIKYNTITDGAEGTADLIVLRQLSMFGTPNQALKIPEIEYFSYKKKFKENLFVPPSLHKHEIIIQFLIYGALK